MVELPAAAKCTDIVSKKGYAAIGCITRHNRAKEAVKAEKVIKKRNADFKQSVKTKAKWLEELQTVFNQYVRLRDINEGCISCDKPSNWNGQWHASHYYSRGHSSSLRFNLLNVHKSCSVCNSHLSGNIGEYKPRIIEKIGIDNFNHITSIKSDVKAFDIEWIKKAIKITRKAIKKRGA
jgi:hypothetical protein|tara:strand:- start:12852 stop:13388 length:537 start_codon:yes stop_codon:yes gene_type:complete